MASVYLTEAIVFVFALKRRNQKRSRWSDLRRISSMLDQQHYVLLNTLLLVTGMVLVLFRRRYSIQRYHRKLYRRMRGYWLLASGYFLIGLAHTLGFLLTLIEKAGLWILCIGAVILLIYGYRSDHPAISMMVSPVLLGYLFVGPLCRGIGAIRKWRQSKANPNVDSEP